MELNKEEKEFLKTLVEKEIKEMEESEKKFPTLLNNSPVLSSLYMEDKDIDFLASGERYHQFLNKLNDKLDKL